MKKVLTIAGSDCSGGAGIQADLKTMLAHKVYGMSVITSITSQNTTGVYDVFDLPANVVSAQLDAVFTDIFPDSVKIGMVSSAKIIDTISKKLQEYHAKNIVLDTVMVSTSGHSLLDKKAQSALIEKLFPLADIITPNIPEAQNLCGFKILSKEDMVKAAEMLYKKYNVCVLLKGGHSAQNSDDLLFNNGNITWYSSPKINNPNTHGTGCTLSSAIAANLACGMDIGSAVSNAKIYITGAISAMLDLGKGSGPVDHSWRI